MTIALLTVYYRDLAHLVAVALQLLFYLTPIFAVALEFLIFGVVPTGVSALGIAVTMAGVALVVWRR